MNQGLTGAQQGDSKKPTIRVKRGKKARLSELGGHAQECLHVYSVQPKRAGMQTLGKNERGLKPPKVKERAQNPVAAKNPLSAKKAGLKVKGLHQTFQGL